VLVQVQRCGGETGRSAWSGLGLKDGLGSGACWGLIAGEGSRLGRVVRGANGEYVPQVDAGAYRTSALCGIERSLRHTPLSVVQAVLSGGLVFLGVLAERYFGFHLDRRQWAGVIITASGLAVIAVTGGRHTSAVPRYSLAALIAVECGVFALGAALIGIALHGSVDAATEGLPLGVAAGVLFGVSDIALKYVTKALHEGLNWIVTEWTLTALAASVLALYAPARGLRLAPGVAGIADRRVATPHHVPRSASLDRRSGSRCRRPDGARRSAPILTFVHIDGERTRSGISSAPLPERTPNSGVIAIARLLLSAEGTDLQSIASQPPCRWPRIEPRWSPPPFVPHSTERSRPRGSS
jgi:hypothetical protein